MVKQPKGRIAEQQYLRRARALRAKRKRRTKARSPTPWREFFESGVGATIRTEIPKSSVSSIAYTYGKRLKKRFKCSYEQEEDCALVKIVAVKRR